MWCNLMATIYTYSVTKTIKTMVGVLEIMPDGLSIHIQSLRLLRHYTATLRSIDLLELSIHIQSLRLLRQDILNPSHLRTSTTPWAFGKVYPCEIAYIHCFIIILVYICGVEEQNLSGEVSQGIAPPIGGDESSSPLVIYAHSYFVGIIPEQRLFVSYDCYDYLSISIREDCQVLVDLYFEAESGSGKKVV